ncbi:terminase small subunit [Paracoccus saliphilus]|uniref:DUF1441 family protein n=1 Tax=Paracoccus saliphilus TaxID=405559 RepID=A0AA46A6H5_9RHOB|nr:terminase small subunit [Paracoccus saliphilus]WCR01647.1 DUF1441 family protein [Paracoccus saliphilus]SIS98366.1 Protein of unknown function [Paracoccus saliphilus]
MSDLITLSTGEVLDVAAWPLPEGAVDDGQPVSRSRLATIFCKSENTITDWIAKGMPVASGGRNGVSYEFNLAHCWAWRQWRDASDEAARRQQSESDRQNRLAFLNHDTDTEREIGHLTPAEIRAMAEAEYHRNRVAEQRGDLVRKDRVRAVFEDIFVSIGAEMDTLPDYAEMNFGLSAQQVAQLEERCDQARMDIRQQVEQLLERSGVVVPMTGKQAELGL